MGRHSSFIQTDDVEYLATNMKEVSVTKEGEDTILEFKLPVCKLNVVEGRLICGDMRVKARYRKGVHGPVEVSYAYPPKM